jgi:hypothetical protein
VTIQNPHEVLVQITDEVIAAKLETEADLFPVKEAHLVTPAEPGFYSIFIDGPENLSLPFREILRQRNTRLIYIGVASVSLFKRLVEQDLQHKSPSTFFRGIGAVLGYRPIRGSLIGKGNQNNYKFSAVDTAKIDTWNREHLSVRFVQVDTAAHPSAERSAISRNCPILNTTHNSECVRELAELRSLCRLIALGVPGL